MHTNSIEAHAAGTATFTDRENKIIGAIRLLGHATDRQVKDHLGFADMNAVRPRITELVQAHVLSEVADEIDETTNRTVRVVAINPAFAV